MDKKYDNKFLDDKFFFEKQIQKNCFWTAWKQTNEMS